MAMARELVTEKGIGESADLVWRQLQRQQEEVFGGRAAGTSETEVEPEPRKGDMPEVVIPPPVRIPVTVTQLLMFDMSNEVTRQRKTTRRSASHGVLPDQLGLFQSDA